uniref:Triacylglycerol lipase n=1 Tax=Ascaris lumbricoides TaxID=6252 RepID=A0A0M3I1E1_ASCLU
MDMNGVNYMAQHMQMEQKCVLIDLYEFYEKIIEQVRALIVAVRLYTGRAVDIIAYSLGVPVSRKAILGGKCVDTGEDLGRPLTRFIDTFVGIAGPNHGISLQMGGLSIPGCAFSVLPVSNTQTGLYSGMCPTESTYLQDINSIQGYEAKNIFSIYSKADQLVGYTVCDKVKFLFTSSFRIDNNSLS